MPECKEIRRSVIATLWTVDGQEQTIQLKNGQEFQVAELQELLGGYFECFFLHEKQQVLFFYENAKFEQQPPNHRATQYASSRLFPGDYFAGKVLVLSFKEAGYTNSQ